LSDVRLIQDPVSCRLEPSGEQLYVETEPTAGELGRLLGLGEKIEEEGRDGIVLQPPSDLPVARAVAATTAAVSEQDDSTGIWGYRQIGLKACPVEGDLDWRFPGAH
jgi:hypothetical protein